MDDGDLQPARRYPPLQRTPPDYQTVIKFLVMASILDSVWVSGPQQTGSSCGLAGADVPLPMARPMARPMTRPVRRPLDLSPEPACNHTAGRLPADVEEALQQLNITAKDCRRHPDELRLHGAAPTVLRVLSVLLFNAFVVWSDFGASLVASPEVASRRLPPSSARVLPAGPDLLDPGIDGAPSWRLGEKGSTSAGPSSPGPGPGTGHEEATSAVLARAETSVVEDRRPQGGQAVPSAVVPSAVVPSAEVPWYIQLAYFATLVVVVVGMPCCPAVLENACGFLMC